MLASANMLAPKPPVKSCVGDSNPLSGKQMSAARTTVHEMQLFKMQGAESLRL
jgi:hypothetical protein